jgi:hypothetical protein
MLRSADSWRAQGIVTNAVDLSKVVNYKYLDAAPSGKSLQQVTLAGE